MNGMRDKKRRKQYAAQWTAEGLPRDPNAWTVEDWAAMWRFYQKMVSEVSEAHKNERRSSDGLDHAGGEPNC